jgi:hypothetical protein
MGVRHRPTERSPKPPRRSPMRAQKRVHEWRAPLAAALLKWRWMKDWSVGRCLISATAACSSTDAMG